MNQYHQGVNEDVSHFQPYCRPVLTAIFLAGMMAYLDDVNAQSAGGGGESGEIRIVEVQGTVELMPAGAQTWVFTQTNQVLHAADRLRTGANSRVTLLWCDKSVVPFSALSEIEIWPRTMVIRFPAWIFFMELLRFSIATNPGASTFLRMARRPALKARSWSSKPPGQTARSNPPFRSLMEKSG